jgi:uncharacterized protein
MKYLLVFLVFLLIAWRWRSARDAELTQTEKKKAAAQALPIDMVACAHCGVHLPMAESIAGHSGSYCSSNHRSLAES